MIDTKESLIEAQKNEIEQLTNRLADTSKNFEKARSKAELAKNEIVKANGIIQRAKDKNT